MLSVNYHHNCFLIEGFFPKKSTVFEIEEFFFSEENYCVSEKCNFVIDNSYILSFIY